MELYPYAFFGCRVRANTLCRSAGWVVLKSDFFKDTTGNYLSDTCELLYTCHVSMRIGGFPLTRDCYKPTPGRCVRRERVRQGRLALHFEGSVRGLHGGCHRFRVGTCVYRPCARHPDTQAMAIHFDAYCLWRSDLWRRPLFRYVLCRGCVSSVFNAWDFFSIVCVAHAEFHQFYGKIAIFA